MCFKKPPDTRAGHLQMVCIHAAGTASDKDLRIKSNQNSVLARAMKNNASKIQQGKLVYLDLALSKFWF